MPKYIGRRDSKNMYEFDCPRCEARGEMGVGDEFPKLVRHDCGQLFIQRASLTNHGRIPRLEVFTNPPLD